MVIKYLTTIYSWINIAKTIRTFCARTCVCFLLTMHYTYYEGTRVEYSVITAEVGKLDGQVRSVGGIGWFHGGSHSINAPRPPGDPINNLLAYRIHCCYRISVKVTVIYRRNEVRGIKKISWLFANDKRLARSNRQLRIYHPAVRRFRQARLSRADNVF